MSDNMDIVDILKELQQSQQIQDSTKVVGEKTVEQKATTPITQVDSIQQAEISDAEKGVQAPGNPMPPEPSQQLTPKGSDIEAFLVLFSKVQNTVITHILDAWEANIAENKRIDKEEMERKIRMGLDQVSHFTASSVTNDDAGEGLATSIAFANYTSFMFASALTISQMGAATNYIVMNNLHNLTPGVFSVAPVELQSLIAMTGALVSSGILAPVLTAMTSRNEQTKGDFPKFAFATQIAMQTLKLVQQGVIRDVVNKHGLFASLTSEQRAQLISRMNLTFLLNSLALFYEKETGWVTEEELTDMISKGKIFQQIQKENPQDPRLALVAAIRQEMRGLSASDRKTFMKDALRYLSRNPSYSSERDLDGLLKKMWKYLDYEQMSGNAA